MKRKDSTVMFVLAAALLLTGSPHIAGAGPLPGGTLDPLAIPKYVTPLVIPPEMPKSTVQPTDPANPSAPQPAADYNIAVRQFKQQILPAGFQPTTVWSYGRAEDAVPAVAPAPGSSFNYPAFTVEAESGELTRVRWINGLKDASGNPLPHLFPVDQTLHWANPAATGCMDGSNRTDCTTDNPAPYLGPVPIVTHVHGAHVNAESDGFPEAWWLPGNYPGYSATGSRFTQFDDSNTVPGSAFYGYENSQPASTLWYHDHSMGMTRLNVYAGPAGFWLVRGGAHGDAGVMNGATSPATPAMLPGPAPEGNADPNFDAAYRATVREVPIAIQDRSFNADGSLFYPTGRDFFDGFTGPYVPDSDISGTWNPEAFFNTMVVNGNTWPTFEVAPAKYRFRLLNGCNSRFLNLALFEVLKDPSKGKKQKNRAKLGGELPMYQIGAEQGFLPKVVMIRTGSATVLPGDGTVPPLTPSASPEQALLMGPAERADVIVDFSALPDGTVVRMINTAPDAPFGGFPDVPADPSTTGQVMQFVVKSGLLQASDAATTPPENLILPFEGAIGAATTAPRELSLNEMMSDRVCVKVNAAGRIRTLFTTAPDDPNFMMNCMAAGGEPMGPRMALLGTFDAATGMAMPMTWHHPVTENVSLGATEEWEVNNLTMDAHPIHLHLVRFQVIHRQLLDPVTENVSLGATEEWEVNNLTMDAHPIHLHLVRFQVIDRQLLDPVTLQPTGPAEPPLPPELGYKDTVIAYPGQVTRFRATFDLPGDYVWHCHIVEHEDNEMMRPFTVVP